MSAEGMKITGSVGTRRSGSCDARTTGFVWKWRSGSLGTCMTSSVGTRRSGSFGADASCSVRTRSSGSFGTVTDAKEARVSDSEGPAEGNSSSSVGDRWIMIGCVGQRGLVEWTSSEWLFVFLEIKRDRFIAKETIVTSKRNQIGPRKASRTSIGQSGGKDKEYALR